MPVDLSEFEVAKKTGGIPCWYQRLNVTAEQREKLDAAMASADISAPMIASVLATWGVSNAKAGAVYNHRTGACACG